MVAMGFQLYLYCWFGNEVTLMVQFLRIQIRESPNFFFRQVKFRLVFGKQSGSIVTNRLKKI